ncbi:MAG TPA: glycosyltransferase [Candidatus Sulfotelmatobacter sp.]|nr:glycosyltransferase [Candidatus Sulfotelmatobacter sp.]
MKDRRLRVLYLGNAFPPGMTGEKFVSAHSFLVPHLSETLLIQELSKLVEVSSVGLLPGTAWHRTKEPKDDSPGLAHDVVLWDRNPALWHRWVSWRKLRTYYLDKVQRGQMPDVLLVRNLQPVFNYFVKWVGRQQRRPIVVLLLGDSGGVGEKISSWRRFRYKFKPMQMLEEEAILLYDACLVSGLKAKRFFEPRGVPWVWIPSGFHFKYDPPPPNPNQEGPIRFGYFGTLTERSGIRPLVNAFVEMKLPGTLHACGHGELSEELKQLSQRYPNFYFDGFLPKQSDCLPWAQQVDVLVNLRLPYWGQDNSAPSKVFEYGMAGKAIISTRTSGMDEVLGDEGLYIEIENFEESLRQKLKEVSAMSRPELQRRARIIRERILKDYSWGALARRSVEFFDKLTEGTPQTPGTAAKNGGQT